MPSPLAEHLPRLLWEMDPDAIDPQTMYKAIIKRVIERGTKEDWTCMLAYYGPEQVRQVVLTTPYLSAAGILAACRYFQLDQETLLCYQRKQSNPVPFNF